MHVHAYAHTYTYWVCLGGCLWECCHVRQQTKSSHLIVGDLDRRRVEEPVLPLFFYHPIFASTTWAVLFHHSGPPCCFYLVPYPISNEASYCGLKPWAKINLSPLHCCSWILSHRHENLTQMIIKRKWAKLIFLKLLSVKAGVVPT